MSCYPKEMFVEENIAKSVSCPICLGVPRDPVTDQCGHTFGRECLRTLALKQPTCPFTKKPFAPEDEWVPAYAVISILSKSSVRCQSNAECPWNGKLEGFEHHLKTDCLFTKAKCHNKGCDFSEERRQVQQHAGQCDYRLNPCSHCLEEFRFFELRDHEKACPLKIVPCPNTCGQQIKNKDVSLHTKSECPESILDCGLKMLGCGFSGKKKDLQQHNSSAEGNIHHLALLVNSMLQQKKDEKGEVAQIKDQILKLTEKISSIKEEIKNQTTSAPFEGKHADSKNDQILMQINDLRRELKELKQATYKVDHFLETTNSISQNAIQMNESIHELKQTNSKIETALQLINEKCEELKLVRNDFNYFQEKFNPEKSPLFQNIKDVQTTNKPKNEFSQNFKRNGIELLSPYEAKNYEKTHGVVLLSEAVVPNKKYCFEITANRGLVHFGFCLKSVVEKDSWTLNEKDDHGYYLYTYFGTCLVHPKKGLCFPKMNDPNICVHSYGDKIELSFDDKTRSLDILSRTKNGISGMLFGHKENLLDLHPCVYLEKDTSVRLL